MKIAYHVGGIELGAGFEQDIIDAITVKAAQHFTEEIGPLLVAQAKDLCPVRAETTSKNPRTLHPVRLRPAGHFRRAAPEKRARRAELEAVLAETRGSARLDVLRSSDIEFFQGKGERAGHTPGSLDVRRGGLVGSFATPPGTLRDSIRLDGVHREENRVIGVVRAHADYAWFVHEGFTHVGGKAVAPRPFLVQAFPSITDRLFDPKAYG